MSEQLRFNTGKVQWHYWLSTVASTWNIESEVLDRDTCLDALSRFARGVYPPEALLHAVFTSVPDAPRLYCLACMKGAEKYERGNFRLGAPVSQFVDSAARHILAPEEIDPESNLPHIAHFVWNVVQIYENMFYNPSRDDRLFHCGFYGKEEKQD